jgi:hypothetical protein
MKEPVDAGPIDLNDPANLHMASQVGHRVPPRLRLTTKLYERRVQQLASVVEIGLNCYARTPGWRFVKRHNSAHRVLNDVLALREAQAELASLLDA